MLTGAQDVKIIIQAPPPIFPEGLRGKDFVATALMKPGKASTYRSDQESRDLRLGPTRSPVLTEPSFWETFREVGCKLSKSGATADH